VLPNSGGASGVAIAPKGPAFCSVDPNIPWLPGGLCPNAELT